MKQSGNNEKKFSYPQKGTTKRVISGSFLTFLGTGIGALKHILFVPLFLRAWGNLVYGEWLTVYALVAYLSLADIGMQNYAVNRLTQCYSRGDLKEYAKIFQSALRLYLIIILIISLFFLVFVFLTPFNQWFNINLTNATTIKITVFILGIYLLLGIPVGFIFGLYRSFGEYPRQAILSNLTDIIFISLIATALFLKSNFIVVSSLHFIPLFALISYCLLDIKHRHKEVQFGLSSADWKLSLSFIGPGLFFLMFPLADVLKIQGSVLAISSIIGTGAVAIFSVHRILANLTSTIVNSINLALWPEITAIEARGDYPKMQLAFNFSIKLSLFSSFSFVTFLFFAGKDIIRIWTQNTIEFQPILWLLFLIYLPFVSFWQTSGIFQVSTNKHKKYALTRIISAILGIMLAIILTKNFGIVGTLSGFLIAECLICGTVIPLETLRIIKANKRDFWLNTVGKSFMIVLSQISVAWILTRFSLNIFVQCVLLIMGISSIGLLTSYLFWFKKDEWYKISQLIKVFNKVGKNNNN